jgi:dTDP-glucose pyrophosphorylase
MATARALVLARGLGTRMRREDPGASLSAAQRRAADAGLKTLMPIGGRPFLDYALSALADTGVQDVGLVVAPDHAALAAHYAANPPSRVRLTFVVQREPHGTADAILAARDWTAGAPFLAMNADNLYPVPALSDLASLDEPGLPAFDADDLVRTSNIPEARIRAFAVIKIDEAGYLSEIVEKPAQNVPPEGGNYTLPEGTLPEDPVASAFRRNQSEDPVASAFRRNPLVSMNLWRFDSRIFDACRDVPRSARGEFELPEAVGLAVRRGVCFRAVAARGPVLDLSHRTDAIDVERRLAGVVPRP